MNQNRNFSQAAQLFDNDLIDYSSLSIYDNDILPEAIIRGDNTNSLLDISIEDVANKEELIIREKIDISSRVTSSIFAQSNLILDPVVDSSNDSLDIDGNNEVNSRDYTLINLYANFGDDTELFNEFLENEPDSLLEKGATRNTGEQLTNYLVSAQNIFDIDGNGTVQTSDYNLLDLYQNLATNTGDLDTFLQQNADILLGERATRNTKVEIINYIEQLIPAGNNNQAPVIESIPSLSVIPGSTLEIPLIATDADGDTIAFSLEQDNILPTGNLAGNNTLTFTPTPEQLGSYEFTVIADDGIDSTKQTVKLDVVADPITTTRISGVIQNVDLEPLGGAALELAGVSTTTAADGSFTLEFTGELSGDDFIHIKPQQAIDGAVYPNISERLSLLLEREPYTAYNNIIDRPIYLPAIDTENAVSIDPAVDTKVTTEAIPGAEVVVNAGTLENQSGEAFTGKLSITEVPVELTPAVLPDNLLPDLVVTIQPGEMAFNNPAPLSLPNRGGYEPGEEMTLWSINPATGDFDDVGTGRVSNNGRVIETIEGGINSSSWHFFGSVPDSPDPKSKYNQDNSCGCPSSKATVPGTSDVELHSGAVIETHDLATYQSLGVDRGLSLTYDSQRADPRPIVNFGYSDAGGNFGANAPFRLIAELSVTGDNFEYQVPGFAGGEYGLDGGEHFWTLPRNGTRVDAALQADLSSFPSGLYDYDLTSGLVRFNGEEFNGTTSNTEGDILHVNTIGSSFGNGWGLAGLQEIIENKNGSILLIDGDGGEVLFEPTASATFTSPAGDFSTLEKLADGTFRRTMKDQTVYNFNSQNQLESIGDRNSNLTRYTYNNGGNLSKIIDPLGLETSFTYTGDRISKITDPTGRVTQLQYDDAGNLIQIIDPDGSQRTWEYDRDRHMTAEIDKLGNREEAFYDFAGRADKALLKDGQELDFEPIQVQGLYPADATIDPNNAPEAFELNPEPESTYVDANGDAITYEVDGAGQIVSSADGVGALPTVQRNEDNLVTSQIEPTGSLTQFQYDERGNAIAITDNLFAQDVYVISGGDDESDLAVLDSLTEAGFSPTLGVEPKEWDGTQANLSDYEAVVLLNNYNWSSSRNMSAAGQESLIDYVSMGGGLVTGEWLGSNISQGRYNILGAITPGIVDGFNSGGSTTYSQVTDDLVLNQGLPNSFEFPMINLDGGTETILSPKEEATAFYTSSNNEQSGLVGWDYQQGRVISFSTLITDFELADAEYKTLFGNAVEWAINSSRSINQDRIYTYDPTFNQVTSYTDELGRQTLYEIDPNNGNVLSIAQVVKEVGGDDDLVTEFTYTNNGLIDTITDPLGRVTDNDYDAFGRLTSTTLAQGTADEAQRIFKYDLAGNQTAIIDENGNLTEFEYDAVNRLIKIVEADPDSDGALTSPVTTYTYDAVGNLLTVTDPLDNTTSNQYDELNRLIHRTDTQDNTASYNYDAAGNLISTIDPNGNRTQNFYDDRDRLTQTIDPEQGLVRFGYDLNNNLTSVLEVDLEQSADQAFISTLDGETGILNYQTGNFTKFASEEVFYDIAVNNLGDTMFGVTNNDLLYKVDLESGSTSLIRNLRVDLNSLGFTADNKLYGTGANKFYQIDPQTGTASLIAQLYNGSIDGFNSSGDLVFDPNYGHFWATSRTQNSDSLFSIDLAGKATKIGNIGFNQVLGLSLDPQGNLVGFTRDNQQLTIDKQTGIGTEQKIIEGLIGSIGGAAPYIEGNLTSFEYDSRDRLIAETDPNGQTTTYEYNAVNNLIAQSDRNNRRTEFEYDELNRLVTETWVDNDQVINYNYDKVSNLTAVTDRFSSLAYNYDNRDRILSVDNTGTPNAPNVLLNYAYDNLGNMLSVSDVIEGEAAGNNRYSYDALNRLTKLTQSGSGVSSKRVDFDYNALGQFTSIDRYADLAGTQLVTDTTYNYDNLNRLNNLTHNNGTEDIAFYDYTYDAASRITQINDIDGVNKYTYDDRSQLINTEHSNTDNPDESYTYDANGNRVNSSIHGNNYETDIGNRLISDGTYNYDYDNEGNLIRQTEIATRNIQELTWDYRNRLVAVIDKDANGDETQRVEFTYDAFDRRISKTVDTNPQDSVEGTVTHFVYNQDDVHLEFVDNDGATGNNQPTRSQRYLHGANIDQILAQEDSNGNVNWHLTDHLGTVRDLVDNSGDVINHLTYNSFGKVIAETDSSITTRYLYTGREYDEEIDLYYYRARYYDAEIGSFISEDPIGFAGGDTNLYRYVDNNPVMWIDPEGLLKRDPDGNLIFNPLYSSNNKHGGKIYDGGSFGGYLFADDGTPIEAFFNTDLNDSRFNTDCHGFSFADAQYWINNDQVEKILRGDGYKETSNPKVGDIAVYKDAKKTKGWWDNLYKTAHQFNLLPEKYIGIVHSTQVASVDKNGDVTVNGLGGLDITPHFNPVTPGRGGGWKSSSATVTYYTR